MYNIAKLAQTVSGSYSSLALTLTVEVLSPIAPSYSNQKSGGFCIGLLTKSGVKTQATDGSTRGTDCEKEQRNELTRGLRQNSNLPKLPINSSVVLL